MAEDRPFELGALYRCGPTPTTTAMESVLALRRPTEGGAVFEAVAEADVKPTLLVLLVPRLVLRTAVLLVRLPLLTVSELRLAEVHIPPIAFIAIIVVALVTTTCIVVTNVTVPDGDVSVVVVPVGVDRVGTVLIVVDVVEVALAGAGTILVISCVLVPVSSPHCFSTSVR